MKNGSNEIISKHILFLSLTLKTNTLFLFCLVVVVVVFFFHFSKRMLKESRGGEKSGSNGWKKWA